MRPCKSDSLRFEPRRSAGGGILIAAFLFSWLSLPAVAADSDLARRQTEQRQARAMARELVSTVLDLQLRQLEENGLTDLPLYADVRTMRASLAELVDTEMAAIVDQLAAVEQATGAEREAKFVEARRSIREVIVRLSVERQTLLRRLKAAELAEQVRRLITLQTEARTATSELPSMPSERRPEATLTVIEDQRDVKGLFVALTDTLADVATWDGPIATAASEGARTLKDADANRLIDDAARALAAASFDEATSHQDAVLAALRTLLASIESAQGAVDAGANTLADAIAVLRDQQQQLRDEIEERGLKTPPEPKQVDAQQAIARSLAEFTDELAGHPVAAPLRAQAEAAANAATTALFTSKEETTLAEQQRAVDRLTALEQTLRDEAGEQSRDHSAVELAKTVEELMQARDELQQARTLHEQAAEQRAVNPQDAVSTAIKASEQTGVIDDGKQLPAAVVARLADAADAARIAADALAAGDDESANPAAADAFAAAGDAFQRASAAIEETLADTARATAAVRIGELARAAEAIERAAAAERELAAMAAKAEQSGGLTTQQAGAMSQVQSDVIDVAAKSAEGVKTASPTSAEMLTKALASAKQVEEALEKTKANGDRQPSGNEAAKPGEPARESDALRSPVVVKATETARHLTEAAATLRREIGSTANSLADAVDEQLTPVATAQQAVQRATETLKATPPSADAAANAAEASSQAEIAATSASQAARKALEGHGTPTDAADALDRAAISLAAREQQLRQDQQLARQLAQLAKHQQTASDAIASTRQSLSEAPSDPDKMSPQQREQAKSLHAATRQFAAAQRATGQGAAMVSGQQQIMNPPIREALQAAERLPVPQLPAEPVDEQVAQASEEGQPSENAEPSEAGEPGEQQTPSNDASQQTASSGKPGQAANAASSNGMPQPTGLGTGLVPAAPDETARMMAGPDAAAALAAMAAAGMESMEDVAASETSAGAELPEGTPAPDGMTDSQTASAKGTVPSEGSPADSDSQTADAAPRDAAPGSTANTNAPWFAKLPPEVRAAIRASSSQPAPKGYEGRLKRYFESVE